MLGILCSLLLDQQQAISDKFKNYLSTAWVNVTKSLLVDIGCWVDVSVRNLNLE